MNTEWVSAAIPPKSVIEELKKEIREDTLDSRKSSLT
jgi:hypothetical protein